jgi:proteasome assembly chaperone (PAC2) family protein
VEKLREEYPVKIYKKLKLQNSSLVIVWNKDVSKLGANVIDYLDKKLGFQEFCEFEPGNFFFFEGVEVEDDLIQFPEVKFYASKKNNLLIFKSDLPQYNWYKFLNLILDIAEHNGKIKELYTIGGIISLIAHTEPRKPVAVFNSIDIKKSFSNYNLELNIDYKTPPDQRPTLNSFLLWIAKKRNIPGISLWVPIPFYFVSLDDPKAQKSVLEFFNQRFTLGINLKDLDLKIEEQNKKIEQTRIYNSEIDDCIKKVEGEISLSEEENLKLIKFIEENLKK